MSGSPTLTSNFFMIAVQYNSSLVAQTQGGGGGGSQGVGGQLNLLKSALTRMSRAHAKFRTLKVNAVSRILRDYTDVIYCVF